MPSIIEDNSIAEKIDSREILFRVEAQKGQVANILYTFIKEIERDIKNKRVTEAYESIKKGLGV